jgi:voltage-gated potassium channel
MLRSFVQRFALTAIYCAVLVVVGTIGYALIEGWSLQDSLYMSVITLTAVGFREVQPLTVLGRYFTMGLLACGITALGLWFALITSLIVELDLANILRRKRSMKEIAELRDHIIICGVGRTGRHLLSELAPATQAYVAIDRDDTRIELAREEDPDLKAITGDATLDHTLELAGINRASALVSCLSADTDNVYVCLSARALNPDMTIVARAYDEESVDKLYRAGANHVVSPNVSGAVQMASFLLRPSVVSFLDVAFRSPEVSLRLEQATVGKQSTLNGRTLREARIREETGLMVIALRKGGSHSGFVFNPLADTVLETGDEMIVLGKPDQLRHLRRFASADGNGAEGTTNG